MRLLILAAALAPGALYADIVGPDVFGYTGRTQNEVGGIAYNFQSITGTGTRLLQGDDGTANVGLGTGFRFYGTDYNSTVVSTNGNIQFASNSAAYTNTALPNSGFGPTIFAFWFDLYFNGAPQGVYTQYFSGGIHPGLSGPTTVFEWQGFYYQQPHLQDTVVRVQLLLEHSTGRILTQYYNTGVIDLPGTLSGQATIGIQQGGPGGSSLQWQPTDTHSLRNSTMLFTPPSSVPEPSTYALMGASLLGISVLGRVRRRKL